MKDDRANCSDNHTKQTSVSGKLQGGSVKVVLPPTNSLTVARAYVRYPLLDLRKRSGQNRGTNEQTRKKTGNEMAGSGVRCVARRNSSQL